MVKRFCKVVVGPRRQSFYHTLLLGLAGQKDDVRVGCLRSCPDVLADFEARQIGHHPIDNHKRRMLLREKIERLAPALSEYQGILFFRQRELNELARYGRIVGHQNLDRLSGSFHLVPQKARKTIHTRQFQTAAATRDQSAGGKLTGQKLGAGNSNANATENRPSFDASTRTILPDATFSFLGLVRISCCPLSISIPMSNRPPCAFTTRL